MNIEEQVLTLEQAKHLQELGLDMSDAALGWYPPILEGEQWEIIPITEGIRDVLQGKEPHVVTPIIPTYTLQEVLDKLPYKIKTPRYDILQLDFIDYELMYHDKETGYVKHWETGKIIESAYDMLCWVIENGYLQEEHT